jgi:hypothetical protein
MQTAVAAFVHLTEAVALASADRIAYPLAELNDLLTAAPPEDVHALPMPRICDAYRLNYVTAMVEVASHRAGVLPPEWTASILPLPRPVFADSSLRLRSHLLTASPPPFRRRNIFIDSTVGDRV